MIALGGEKKKGEKNKRKKRKQQKRLPRAWSGTESEDFTLVPLNLLFIVIVCGTVNELWQYFHFPFGHILYILKIVYLLIFYLRCV